MSYHLDYETFSEQDLRTVGAYRYALDDTTEILMFSISRDEDGPYLWVNPKYGKSDPRAVRMAEEMAESDEEIWAHYATFEIAISGARWKKDVKLPPLNRSRFRCTALLARCAGLPDKLETLARTLKLAEQKDERGAKLIRTFCSPDPRTGKRTMPKDKPEEFRQLGVYCLQDVRAERAAHSRLQPFSLRGAMLDTWLFDINLNDRGIPVNVRALRTAQAIIEEATATLTARFRKLVGLNPTQRDKVKGWFAKRGLELPNMQSDTIERALEEYSEEDLRDGVYRALYLYSRVQYTAVKKVQTMLDCVCPDGYVRGTLLMHGAGTGRWTGRLIQPQNFKRPTVKDAYLAYALICRGCTLEDIELLFGKDSALDVISSCIRNFIQWSEGWLLDADYAAIEARIVCWLAGQEDILEEYRRGVDQYVRMAAMIYSIIESKVSKDQRELGKRAVLGCGFSMAAAKFQKTCWEQYGLKIPLSLAERAVEMYRARHRKVKSLWYSVERAAKNAITYPGKAFLAGELLRLWVATVNGIPFLFMRLPSGRKLAYPYPELTYNSKRENYEITFFGELKNSQWGRVGTYGGKLVENATQGTAADIMAHGSVNAEREGFEIITLIHDQAPAKKKPGQEIEEYIRALTELPPWAEGLPIKAEGKPVPYYRK